ncbi:MAG: hypothetical protein U1F10_10145 [Burkholderiales bacterium]
MKFTPSFLAALLVLVAASANAELPPLAADSAALDRAYIPALMASGGKDLAKAQAAQKTYETAWAIFAERQRKAFPGNPEWTKVLAESDNANVEASAALANGKSADAHAAQEIVRHALWHQRQAMKVAYQPDLLTDFHATMETIIATAQPKATGTVSADHVATLQSLLEKARTQWASVKGASWNPADYGIEGARLEGYRGALAAEDHALDALGAALADGKGPAIAQAANALKPPFAKAYAAFGVFPQ